MSTNTVICYGEVLWDVFPTHRKIGGAPLNVALRLQSLGIATTMVSSVGNDDSGKQIVEFINQRGVDSSFVQVDDRLATGTVDVTLSEQGNASYQIVQPVAWDAIQLTASLKEEVQKSKAFVYGSLAARSETSRNTLLELLKYATYKVFDVNLRAPHYSISDVTNFMRQADLIKLNDEELDLLCDEWKSPHDTLEEKVRFIAEQTNAYQLCVTLGGDGALFYDKGTFHRHSGYVVDVVDTVGAGDSFLATLIAKLLSGQPPAKALNYACAMGALVASREGANPVITESELETFAKQ